ncbi:aminopeptidase P family protein [Ferroplasma sp.]|uniref:aminopeptidase P family protein n=1 Tax=Ferroplasma sp. TaxID=2591003 RepID=UPI00307E82CE
MREKKIFDYVRNVDSILIMNGGENQIDKTFFYLTGAKSGIFEGSILHVKPEKVTIITSALEEEAAKETGFDVMVYNGSSEKNEILKNAFNGDVNVGLNYSALTLDLYKQLMRIIPDKEFIDVSQSIDEARKIKDESELKNLREAAKIASDSFQDFIKTLKEGMKESELAANVVYAMMRNGASGESFKTIVAFGKNSAMPHYMPGNAKLKKNDFVLIDYGALYNRYCSDMTRTVVFGRADEKQKEMYETVRAAQDESKKALKAGINGKDIDMIARKIIDEKYPGRFIHSLGHGIGLDVHDHPALSPSMDFLLKQNMVVTDEPGVYIPEVGGVRIEDDLIIKKDGHEEITSATRELLEL